MSVKSRIEELRNSENFWLLAYIAISTYVVSVVLFTVLFLIAPFWIRFQNFIPLGIGAVSYNIVSTFVMCHQLPERSFFIFDTQFPICSRCIGIYIGSSIGGLAGIFSRIKASKRMLLLMLIVFTMPIAWDGVTQTLLFERESSNMLRLATGLTFGFGVLYFVTSITAEKARKLKLDTKDGWKLAFVVNALMVLVILIVGFYVGTKYIPEEKAVEIALNNSQDPHLWNVVYYIPPNAVRNIRNDPYFSSYNDPVLTDLYKIRYDEHGNGIWTVILINEDTVEPCKDKRVYLCYSAGYTTGTYIYIDALDGSI
ncbi:MAG: DUF2085 domain-containing protein, partial [Candidatus Altiarchaeota archaeon]